MGAGSDRIEDDKLTLNPAGAASAIQQYNGVGRAKARQTYLCAGIRRQRNAKRKSTRAAAELLMHRAPNRGQIDASPLQAAGLWAEAHPAEAWR